MVGENFLAAITDTFLVHFIMGVGYGYTRFIDVF